MTRPRQAGCPPHSPDYLGLCVGCGQYFATAMDTRDAYFGPVAPKYCFPSLGEPCGDCHRCQPAPNTARRLAGHTVVCPTWHNGCHCGQDANAKTSKSDEAS